MSDPIEEGAAVELAGGFVPRKDDASGIRQSDDGASPKTTEPAHPAPSLPPRERVEGEGLEDAIFQSLTHEISDTAYLQRLSRTAAKAVMAYINELAEEAMPRA